METTINGASGKIWHLIAPDAQIIEEFARIGIDALSARIMHNRKTAPHEAPNILEPRLKTQMPDPYSMMGIEKAVEAILSAIKLKKKIMIFADYDVDGATSAAILLSFFDAIGFNVNVFVPDRIKDGYGPNPQLMHSIKASGADILICVDCGAAAYDALETAAQIGLETIVFDHHLMNENAPPALAMVNPNQYGDNSGLGTLTAAGVCFMAIVALNREAKAQGAKFDFNAIDALDLVALGTVCDVAPLRGLNRVFVAQGQKLLGQLKRTGLKKLAQVSGLKKADNVFACGWVLGPRLNAGGRIGDSSIATKLLTTNDENMAHEYALTLESLNSERRAIELAIIDEAVLEIEKNKFHENPIIIIGKAGWHPGIIGIVAGRIKERYNRPTIILGSINEDDKIAKGSGRSINGFNLGGLIKNAVENGLLLSGGGHVMAAGLACEFENLANVQSQLVQMAKLEANIAIKNQIFPIDAILSLQAINIGLINALEKLAPFGAGWEEPRFLLRNVKIVKSDLLNGAHLRLFIKDDAGNSLNAICFGAFGTKLGDILQSRAACNLVIKVKKDDFRGGDNVSTEIIDAEYAFDAH